MAGGQAGIEPTDWRQWSQVQFNLSREILANPLPEKFQTPFFFLLVGTNPLPNYVAARFLWKRGGKETRLFLVYSDETMNLAKNLAAELECQWDGDEHLAHIHIDETNPDDIFKKISDQVQPLEGSKLGLNYTGGTKAMAVHARRAVEQKTGSVLSFLDAKKLALAVEQPGQLAALYPISDCVRLRIETLLALHGYQFKKTKKGWKQPTATISHEQNKFTTAWKSIAKTERDAWYQNNLKKFKEMNDRELEKDENLQDLRAVKLPTDGKFMQLKEILGADDTFYSLADRWNFTERSLLKWFDGVWLEDYCLIKFLEFNDHQPDAKKFHCWGKNLEAETVERSENGVDPKSGFEFDLFAIRGYQLYGFSVTSEAAKGMAKLKLFEAFVRTHQMGGDESRTALVCYAAEVNPNDPRQHPRQDIQNELEEPWDAAKGKVCVFGETDMDKLDQQFALWFDGTDPHEKGNP